MLPYPSGELHMGHMLNYTIGDVVTHLRRRRACRCCGRWATTRSACPAENAAIKEGGHPRDGRPSATSPRSASRCSGWAGRSTGSREISTARPEYYRWTQWLFLRFFERGLAYRKEAPVKWCPNDQTVLANEQVIDGRCERCGAEVEAQEPEQWFFRITDYADELLDEMALLEALARARPDDAAQLDRPLARARASSSASTAAARSCRSSRRGPTRCSARRSSCSRPSTRWSTQLVAGTEHEAEVRDYVRHAAARSAVEREAEGEGRRLHRPLRGQPGQRRARSRSGSPTTC